MVDPRYGTQLVPGSSSSGGGDGSSGLVVMGCGFFEMMARIPPRFPPPTLPIVVLSFFSIAASGVSDRELKSPAGNNFIMYVKFLSHDDESLSHLCVFL